MSEAIDQHEMNCHCNRFLCSISMTTCSTLLAMGMMPLCLFVYTKMWTDSNAIVLPYDSIGESSEPALSLLTLSFILPLVTTTFTSASCRVMKK